MEDVSGADNAGAQVGQLVSTVASDDDDRFLGLAVVEVDNTNGVWEYRESGGATWSGIPSGIPYDMAFLLPHNSWVRFSPHDHYFGSSEFTALAWDMTNDPANSSFTIVDTSSEDVLSGPYSSGYASFFIDVIHENDPPQVEVNTTGVLYTEGEDPVQIFSDLLIRDVDNVALQSATLLLECPGCEEAENSYSVLPCSNLQPTSGDSICPFPNNPAFNITYYSPVEPSRVELLIAPLSTFDAHIEPFTAYLQSLHFINYDQEPSNAPRYISLTVSDGANSSAPVTVEVEIMLRNDEIPSIELPNDAVTHIEDSGPTQIFISDPSIIDLDDNMLFNLSNATLQLSNADPEYEQLSVDCTHVPFLSCLWEEGSLYITGEAAVSTYEQVLGGVVYENRASEPNSDPRVVTITVNDGIYESPSATLVIEIELINDQVPVLEPVQSMVQFFEVNPMSPPIRVAGNVSISDPDSGNFPVASLEVTLIDPQDVGEERIMIPRNVRLPRFVAASQSDPHRITFSLRENANMSSMMPTLTGLPLPVVQNLINSIFYFNRAVQPTGDNRTVLLTVYDNLTLSGLEPSNVAAVLVDFEFVDDLPVVQLNTAVVMYSEGQEMAEVQVAPDAIVTDVDDSEVAGLFIELVSSSDDIDTSQEVLRVQYPSDLISESNNTEGDNLQILLFGIASTELYTTVLRSLTYEHTTTFGDPDSGNRIIRVTPLDRQGNRGFADSVNIAFTSVDNPPIIDLNGQLQGTTFNAQFEEEGAAISLVSDNFTLIDVDTPGLFSVEINLSAYPDSYEEGIFLQNNMSSSVIVNQSSPFSITLHGTPLAPVEEFARLLRSLHYINTADEPSDMNRTIVIKASDGNNTAEAITVVTIILMNDSPQIALNGDTVDFTTTFTEEGSPVQLAPNPALVDPDSLLVEIRVTPLVSFPGDVVAAASVTLEYNSDINYYFVTLAPSTTSDVEQLLRSVVYNNTLPEPPYGERLYCFEVVDSEQALSNQACTTITLEFMNDNDPSFNRPAYFAQIQENRADAYVTRVTASDADSANTDVQLVYSIVAGDDCVSYEFIESSGLQSGDGELLPGPNVSAPCRFSINSSTGEIRTTNDPPDRELNDLYLLTLRVSDGVRAGYANLTITIIDVNDVPPTFVPDFYNATIPLGAEANYTIATLNVIDPDSVGTVSIFLQFMNPSIGRLFFGLDPLTGRVFLNVPENELDPTVSQYELVFIADDFSGFDSANSATLIINVVLNNADPLFESPDYSASVREDTDLMTTVLSIRATDNDIGSNGQLQYSLSSQDLPFSVDPITGDVFVSTQLDFESTEQYSFAAIASDMGRPIRSGTTQILIQVQNVNEFVPRFTQMVYTIALCEGVSVGDEVLQLVAVDGDSGVFGEVTYGIIAHEGCMNCLAVNSSTGVVAVSKELDFERYTGFRVFVGAGNGDFFTGGEAVIEVTILNDNEFPPEFQFDMLTLSIPENYPVGNPLPIMAQYQPLAVDMDACNIDMCDGTTIINNGTCSPSSSGLTYSVVSGNEDGLFEIRPTTGNILLSRALDFDLAEHRTFVLWLLVSDGEFNSTAQVQITVTDVNDNQPIFDNTSYAVTIPEDTPLESEVLRVSASDADPNSQISFSLAGVYAEHFEINSTTGSITVAVSLDYETISEYELVVIAMDSLSEERSNGTAVFLNISLTDVNDVPPQFTLPEYTFTVGENDSPGVIGRVEAQDMDSVSPLIQYVITSVSPGNGSLFSVDSINGEVSASVVFDREQYDSYSLSIEARDNGTPSLTGTAAISVVILDRNDNIPTFSRTNYNISIPENISIGEVVLQVEAFDLDAGSNAEITFTIESGDDMNQFSINATSDTIQVNAGLDREVMDRYMLVVQASDSGTPPNSASAVVYITITDEGDNPPLFRSSNYSGEIEENSPPGTSVLQVEATDIDLGFNAEIQYTFAPGTGEIPFTIHPISGVISVENSQLLDRESIPLYELYVEAFNPNYPTGPRSLVPVTIQVIDVNDESPTFTEGTFVVSLLESFTPAGESSMTELGSGSGMGLQSELRYVSNVTAIDLDEPGTPNSQFTFSLIGGDREAFSINAENGDIFVSQPFDREVVSFYQLLVAAVDMGTPPQSSRAYVNITILDINDNSPTFSQEVYFEEILEDVSIGIEILRVLATDIDAGSNAQLEFSLANDSVPFNIDPVSGQIAPSASLDRELVPSYAFHVIVRDLGTPSLSSRALVEIALLDVNNKPPVVMPDTVRVRVPENSANGIVIANFVVTDADEGLNAMSTVTISGESSRFSIVNNSVLVVSGTLDYEATQQLNFFVVVRNVVPPHFTETVPVTVELENLNDNPPVVMFGNTDVLVFLERMKQFSLDFDITIVDDDGRNITRLVDGIVEFTDSGIGEPSEPFTSNADQLYLPYSCPLEDDKDTKLEPCGIPLEDEHIFTRPSRDIQQRNLDADDLSDDTILFDAARQQHVYSSVSSRFTTTGLTIFTWIWVDPVPSADMTIVSKSSPSDLLYSLYCSPDLNLNLQYNVVGLVKQTVTFEDGCTQLQNAWHHLAVVLDNSNPAQWQVKVYIDAAFYSSQPIEVPVDAPGSVFVGTRPVSGFNSPRQDFFNGRLHLLVHSYSVVDANNINCAIGCGSSLLSLQSYPTLSYYYDYSRRALLVNGTNPIEIYESFFNSLVIILPLIEPVSDSYDLNYTVQDDVFNCLPTTIRISLLPSNDHEPVLSLSGNPPPDVNYTTRFTEEMGPVSVVNETFFLEDGDLVSFNYNVTVQIMNPQPPGSDEVLSVENVPNEISVSYENYVLTLTGNLPIPMFEEVVRTMRYNNRDDEPGGSSRQLLFIVNDSTYTVTATTTIHLVPINDVPEVNVRFPEVEYNEEQGTLPVLENITITDSDNTTLVSANVSLNALDGAQELLSVDTADTSIVSIYDAATSTLQLVGEDTIENYANVLQSLTYQHQGTSDPTPGTRRFTFTVSDGLGESAPVEAMIFFQSVNDPPVLDLNGPASGFNYFATFVEDVDTSVPAISESATLIDVDNTSVASANISLTPVLDVGMETLTIVAPTDESPQMQFSDTELYIYNEGQPLDINVVLSVLRTVRYENVAEEPTGGVRNIEFVVSDGLNTSIPVYTRLTVETRNDAPELDINTLDSSPGYETTFIEEGPSVYITSRNVSITDNDVGAVVETVMIVIRNTRDGTYERIESSDQNVTISEQSPTVFVISPLSTSLDSVEDLLLTLTYRNAREEPTAGQRDISISVSDGASFSNSEIVRLRVESVNEHSPQFTQRMYSRTALEEQPSGQVVGTVTATDTDGGQDGEISYNITNSDPIDGLMLFRINASSGQIYTTDSLDRELYDSYELTVSATDSGEPVMVDYASVLVTVLDVNDQAPVFSPTNVFNLTVLESRPNGYVIDTVEATDADLGSNALVSYALVARDPTSPFDVLSDGRVIVSDVENLDADSANTVFTITIIARDNGTDPLSSEGTFTITVLDVNDNRPEFVPESNYSGMITENLPPFVPILTVNALDIDSGSNAEITYSFANSLTSDSFMINSTSGEIFSARTFDREEQDSHTFDILAVDNGSPRQSSTATVSVTVIDENDVSPVFSQSFYSGEVRENVVPGTFVLLVSATDQDEGTNANINYTIVPNEQLFPFFSVNPLFRINSTTGEIFVNEMIDFELQPVVNFTVEAHDLGSPTLTGRTVVSVDIIDENDNRPVFNQTSYEVAVPESEANYLVTTIEANDADSDENGQITYRLLNEQDMFSIDPVSGEIRTIDGLDFEADCFYRLMALASDNGMPSLNATVVIDVSVLPIHDVPPSFSPASYTSSILENQPAGMSVIQVSASDGDLLSCEETQQEMPIFGNPEDPGFSGIGPPLVDPTEPTAADSLEYSLLSHEDLFAIDQSTGLVTTLESLDREAVLQYTLRVQARDPSGLTAVALVTVNVLDENDNPPRFLQPSYTVATSENTPVGTSVLQVIASDPDFTDQGRLVYSLSGQQTSFGINSQTGIIFVASPIDFESGSPSITLFAVVTDTRPTEASALVRIIISNVPDIPPEISTPPQTLTFTEGSFSLRPFPQVSITDPDNFQNLCNATVVLTSPQSSMNDANTLSCTCLNSTANSCSQGCVEFIQLPSSAFPGNVTQSMEGSVLVLSGEYPIASYESAIATIDYINLIANPLPQDRTVSLSVNDCQLPSNTLINTISVEPLNMFPPVVDLNGPDSSGNGFVTSFVERGDAVFISSPNATITDEDSAAEVEELTGLDVWVANPLNDALERLIYPEPFVHQTIMVTRNSAFSISFRGVALLSDYEAILTQLQYDNDATEPDPSPRMINVVAHEYHLTSEVSVTTVNIIPINDHPPVILTSPPLENSVISFTEGSSGVMLTSPTAVIDDGDSTRDPITNLEVYIYAPSTFDRIFVQPGFILSPNITVEDATSTDTSLLFRGEASHDEYTAIIRSLSYQYTGEEFESTFPPKFIYMQISDMIYSSFSAVQVNLVPVNDQAPVFTQNTYVAEAVPENATSGYVVIQVVAIDGDRFSPSDIRYSIVGGNDGGTFSISEQTGTITLVRSLDFETTPMYELVVEASDQRLSSSSPVAPSQAAVVIPVGDVNDHVPMFNSTVYNATVGEGVPIGTPVVQLFADDRDSEAHSMLQFALVSDSSDFVIDQTSGVISTNGEIDREMRELYMLFATVRNPGSSAFDATSVTITVLDLDDNPPIINLQQTVVVLREPATSVHLAGNLTITDSDPNPSLDYALVEILPDSDTNDSAVGQLISTVDSDAIRVDQNGTTKLEFQGASQPLSEYIRVLRGIVYRDTSEEPNPADRIVVYQVGSNVPVDEPIELQYAPSETVSNITELVVTVELINDNPPVLLLDARDQADVDFIAPDCVGRVGSYSTSFVEDEEPVYLSHSSFSLTDADSGETFLQYAVVEVVDAQDVGFERLSVQLSGGVTLSSRSDDFTLILEGPAPIDDFSTVLRSIRLVLYVITSVYTTKSK